MSLLNVLVCTMCSPVVVYAAGSFHYLSPDFKGSQLFQVFSFVFLISLSSPSMASLGVMEWFLALPKEGRQGEHGSMPCAWSHIGQ